MFLNLDNNKITSGPAANLAVNTDIDSTILLLKDPTLPLDRKQSLLQSQVKKLQEHLTDHIIKSGFTAEQSQQMVNLTLRMIEVNGLEDVNLANLADKLPSMSEEQFKNSLKSLTTAFETTKITLEKSAITHYGFMNGGLKIACEKVFGKIEDHGNNCGPMALFHLVQNDKHSAVSGKEATAALYKELEKACGVGILGTVPQNLEFAVRHVTNGRLTLERNSFGAADKAVDFICNELKNKQNCIIKYGTGLTSQHYDCIFNVMETPAGRIFATSSGLLIPETHLKKMLQQGPYENTVWSKVNNQMPAVDAENARREFAAKAKT